MNKTNSNTLPIFLLLFLLYFPKINLFRFSTTDVGLKPEDIIVAIIVYSLCLYYFLRTIRFRKDDLTKLISLFIIYIVYLSIVTFFYGGNFLYIGRYILYISMLLLAFLQTERQMGRSIENIAFYSLIIYLIIGLLQKIEVIGGFHTGAYEADVSDRISLMFTNATEVGLITGILYGLVLCSNKRGSYKILSLIVVIIVNLLGQNRIALISILGASFIYYLGLKDMRIKCAVTKPSFTNKFVTLVVLCAISVSTILLLESTSRRSTIVTESVSTMEGIVLLGDMVKEELNKNVTPTDISYYAVGRTGEEGDLFDESLIYRVQKWTYVVNVLLSGYIFGIGAGNAIGDAIDGFYFRLLIESGFIGFLLYLAIFITVFKIAGYKNSFLDGLYFAFIILLIQGIFLDSFYFSRVGYIFWLLVAVKLSSIMNSEISKTGSGGMNVRT